MAVQTSNAAARLAAPQRKAPVRPQKPDVRPHLVPSKQQPRRVQRAAVSAVRIARIAVICVIALTMLSLLIYQRAQLASLNVERVHAEEQLTNARSETVRLEALFNSKVSVENVEEYARNKLGMVKRSSYQVHFFRNDNTDQIVLVDQGK